MDDAVKQNCVKGFSGTIRALVCIRCLRCSPLPRAMTSLFVSRVEFTVV
jgi:hypothetical protein